MKLNAVLAAACLVGSVLVLGKAPALQGQGAAPQAQAAPQAPILCQGQPGFKEPQGAAAPPAAAPQAAGRGNAQPAPTPRQVTVAGIPGIIAAGATFTQVFQTAGNNADGIIALDDGSLLINQEDNSAIVKLDKDDRTSIFMSDTHGSGSLSRDQKGRIFAVQRLAQPGTPAFSNPSAPKTAGVFQLYPERKIVADTFSDGTKWTGRPNDLTVDSQGGAYFTQGCAYYASPSGKITLVGENVRSNGIILSPDEKTLYVTNGPTLAVFDTHGPDPLTNRREWKLEAGGNGDGSTVDATGRVYVTSAPGIQIFSPDGKHLGLIPTPRGVTGSAFAGPDRRTLYVVGQGSADASGQQSAQAATGRTVYRIAMLAEGLKGRK